MKSPLTIFLGLVFAAWFIVLQQLPLGEVQSDYIEIFPIAGEVSNGSLSKLTDVVNYEVSNEQFSKTEFLVNGNIDLPYIHQPHAFQYFIHEYLTLFFTSYDRHVLVAYLHQYNQTLLFKVFSIFDSTAYQLKLDEVTAHT